MRHYKPRTPKPRPEGYRSPFTMRPLPQPAANPDASRPEPKPMNRRRWRNRYRNTMRKLARALDVPMAIVGDKPCDELDAIARMIYDRAKRRDARRLVRQLFSVRQREILPQNRMDTVTKGIPDAR